MIINLKINTNDYEKYCKNYRVHQTFRSLFCYCIYYTYRTNKDVTNDKTDYVVLFDPNEGEFSQWHPAECTLDGIRFNCAEQLMMYAKASKCIWICRPICGMIYCESKSKSNVA